MDCTFALVSLAHHFVEVPFSLEKRNFQRPFYKLSWQLCFSTKHSFDVSIYWTIYTQTKRCLKSIRIIISVLKGFNWLESFCVVSSNDEPNWIIITVTQLTCHMFQMFSLLKFSWRRNITIVHWKFGCDKCFWEK